MTTKRRTLAVRISDDARTAIDRYCSSHGITVTAWVEALGDRLRQLQDDERPDTPLREVAAETVRIARVIDAERRMRAKGT